jgi:hypothetical protein
MTTVRDKFEAWAITQHLAIHRNGGEQYVNTATQHVWDGWKACWPQAMEQAATEAASWKGAKLLLNTGELSFQEKRSCVAVASGISAAIGRLVKPEGELS